MESYTLESVAEMFNVAHAELLTLLRQTTAPLRQRSYYHYLLAGTGGAPSASSGPRAGRTVLLFRSPDEALVFAQLVRVHEVPRVRPASAEGLVLRLLADSRLERLVFLEEDLESLPSGLRLESLSELPGAHVVERDQLVDYFA